MLKKSILISAVCISFGASASGGLFMDYQGMTKKKLTPLELRKENGVPDGFSLLTDQYRGLVHQIGEGMPKNGTSMGVDFELDLALSMIVPAGWIVWADDLFVERPLVSWDAEREPWLTTLSKIGYNYGIQYVIDWDQMTVQLTKDKDFVKPDYNQPAMLDVPGSENDIFIYTTDKKRAFNEGGFLLIDGKLVPVKVKE